jgi:hypothetical protein
VTPGIPVPMPSANPSSMQFQNLAAYDIQSMH